MPNNDLFSKGEFLEVLEKHGADIRADYDAYEERGYSLDLIRQTLDKLTPVDAAPEVVRCIFCKHARNRSKYERKFIPEGVMICTNLEAYSEGGYGVVPMSYSCKYGEHMPIKKAGE